MSRDRLPKVHLRQLNTESTVGFCVDEAKASGSKRREHIGDPKTGPMLAGMLVLAFFR